MDFLHERGYQFIGDTSFYKLTYNEIIVLRRGFEKRKEEERKQMEEENPELRKQRPREADQQALENFKSEHNLT